MYQVKDCKISAGFSDYGKELRIATNKYIIYWNWENNILDVYRKERYEKLLNIIKPFDLSYFIEYEPYIDIRDLVIIKGDPIYINHQIQKLLTFA